MDRRCDTSNADAPWKRAGHARVVQLCKLKRVSRELVPAFGDRRRRGGRWRSQCGAGWYVQGGLLANGGNYGLRACNKDLEGPPAMDTGGSTISDSEPHGLWPQPPSPPPHTAVTPLPAGSGLAYLFHRPWLPAHKTHTVQRVHGKGECGLIVERMDTGPLLHLSNPLRPHPWLPPRSNRTHTPGHSPPMRRT